MGWLVSVALAGGADASSVTVCPNRRLRTNASTAHPTGESTGVGGRSGANGPKPANPSTPNTAPPMVVPGGMESAWPRAEMAWLATTSVCGTEKALAVTAVTACGAAG